MPVVAAAFIGAGATAYAASKAKKGNAAATKAQTDANNAAIAQQQAAGAKAEALSAPWRTVGMQALGQLSQAHGITLPPDLQAQLGIKPGDSSGAYGGFTESPDYAFRRDQGLRAITGNAAAKGLLDSGALGKGLIDYAGKSASQEFGSWYNRLASLSDQGRAAAGTASGVITNTAANVSNLTTSQGQNLAQGAATSAGIQSGLISSLGGIGAGLIREYGGRSSAPTTQAEAIAAANTGIGNINNTATLGRNLWGSSL